MHEFLCRGHRILLANTKVGPQGGPSPFAALAPSKREVVSSAAAFARMVDDLAREVGGGQQRETTTREGVCRSRR